MSDPVAVPDDLDRMPPGPGLEAVLDGLDMGRLDRGDAVEVLRACYRQQAHAQARTMAAAARVAHTGYADPVAEGVAAEPGKVGEFAAEEIQAALRLTRRGAQAFLEGAVDLVDRLPAVHAALSEGRIDARRAWMIADRTWTLEPHERRAVADEVLERAERWTSGQVAAAVTRAVLKVDPKAAKERYHAAVTDRRVQHRLFPEGTASLHGVNLPVDAAVAASANLDALAQATKRGGDPRTLAQLRCDHFLQLLTGVPIPPPRLLPDDLSPEQAADRPPQAVPPGLIVPPPRRARPTGTRSPFHPAGSTGPAASAAPSAEDDTPPWERLVPSDPPGRTTPIDPTAAGSHPAGASSARPSPAGSAPFPVEPSPSELPPSEPSPSEPSPSGPSPSGPSPSGPSPSGPSPSGPFPSEPSPSEPSDTTDGGSTGRDTTRRHPGASGDPVAQPEPVTMPQWRTAVLTGSTTPAVTVNLHLDLTTLMGLNDRPGHLPGWGPVLADIARHLAADHPATWRWRLTDTDHELIHTGKTTARPAASLLAHIRDRDITCRFPGCRTPATRSDIDHTIARTEGGGHHPDNLGALCRRHHRAKHEGGWQLSQPKPGHFIWTSPHGRTYTVTPDHDIPP